LLPPQYNNEELTREEQVRDLLSLAGLREVINYRLTTPEAEARLDAPGLPSGLPQTSYVTLANPISADKASLRHTLLNGILENVVANARHTDRQKLFEIGSVFLPAPGVPLPDEPRHLGIALTGPRDVLGWQDAPESRKNQPAMDFFDLKGVLQSLADGLRLPRTSLDFKPEVHGSYHPGRCAALLLNGKRIGFAGEVHPLVLRAYGLEGVVVAAELDLDVLLADLPEVDQVEPLTNQPAVYQDIALVVSDATPASAVENAIREAGGALLRRVELFDVYRGDPIPPGKKSLAYSLTYQADDRTLTDAEVAKVHASIARAVERRLEAKVRG
jgi:phenylalanyl-tRNA synthetase beta chain